MILRNRSSGNSLNITQEGKKWLVGGRSRAKRTNPLCKAMDAALLDWSDESIALQFLQLSRSYNVHMIEESMTKADKWQALASNCAAVFGIIPVSAQATRQLFMFYFKLMESAAARYPITSLQCPESQWVALAIVMLCESNAHSGMLYRREVRMTSASTGSGTGEARQKTSASSDSEEHQPQYPSASQAQTSAAATEGRCAEEDGLPDEIAQADGTTSSDLRSIVDELQSPAAGQAAAAADGIQHLAPALAAARNSQADDADRRQLRLTSGRLLDQMVAKQVAWEREEQNAACEEDGLLDDGYDGGLSSSSSSGSTSSSSSSCISRRGNAVDSGSDSGKDGDCLDPPSRKRPCEDTTKLLVIKLLAAKKQNAVQRTAELQEQIQLQQAKHRVELAQLEVIQLEEQMLIRRK